MSVTNAHTIDLSWLCDEDLERLSRGSSVWTLGRWPSIGNSKEIKLDLAPEQIEKVRKAERAYFEIAHPRSRGSRRTCRQKHGGIKGQNQDSDRRRRIYRRGREAAARTW